MQKTGTSRHSAFTLVEILVVLAIIGILAAILFPAFARAQETARQTNCASNLQQIGVAVQQYKQDFRRYPDSLVDLLPTDADFDDGTIAPPAEPGVKQITRGTGYLKGGVDALVCPNDDNTTVHSSYGALLKFPPALATGATMDVPGKYVFNYWGYKADGFVLTSPQGVADLLGSNPSKMLVNSNSPYSASAPLSNPVKYSLSNRLAPPQTIITHCVYHRPNTANDIALPTDLYATPAIGDGTGARDIVLRLDGSAKALDVSQWNVETATKLANWKVVQK